jgi:putative solute:sodium symporter small subunit
MSERVTINLFRPEGERLRQEVAVIRIVLFLWAVIAFGLPLFIWLCGLGDPQGFGASWLTRTRVFGGFPLHYWLIAQGGTIAFVLLCKLYTELLARALRKIERPWHAEAGQGGDDV